MHAKVVVIDRCERSSQARTCQSWRKGKDIELGVLINHAPTAARIVAYFEGLRACGALQCTARLNDA